VNCAGVLAGSTFIGATMTAGGGTCPGAGVWESAGVAKSKGTVRKKVNRERADSSIIAAIPHGYPSRKELIR